MQLNQLIGCLRKKKIVGDIDGVEVFDICFDGRQAAKGSLFIAMKGGNADGNDFVRQAEENGACAVVTEIEAKADIPVIVVDDARKALSSLASRFYGDPSKKLKVVGVTGTNGKTTTCHMLASILSAAGKKTGVVGTLGAFFDGREFPCSLTTPDPVYFQYLLAEMVKSGVEYCVAEISAHALWFDKEYSVTYKACIFTNLTQDHLDFFSDMSEYGDAKKKLFFSRVSEFSVVNVDDPFGRAIAADSPDAVTYALNNPSDVFCVVEEEGADGTLILMNLCDELCEARVRLVGEYNVCNAMAAAACAWKMGVSMENISLGISSLKGVAGRLEQAAVVNGGRVFVDFAHTPDGLEKSLSSLKRICRGKLYCLFGCGGNRDRSKRPLMGEISARLADFTVVTSDNPRYEPPCEIIAEVEKGIPFGSAYVAIEDREQAISYALRLLNEGDILLIAGKGAERYQEIMGIKYDYSDYTVIKKMMG